MPFRNAVMLLRLLLLFILAAAAELALLGWLAQRAGFAATLLVIVGTGLVGASLARWQGLRAWRSIRSDLAAGRLPAASVVDGVTVLLAGALLIAPGLISDVCGFLLLIPQVRRIASRNLIHFLKRRLGAGFERFGSRVGGSAHGEIIDAEFRRTDVERIENRPPE